MRTLKRARIVGDRACRTEHALFVVVTARRCACGEDDLAAVHIDVGREEADAVRLSRGLRAADERVEHGGGGVRAGMVEDGVGAVEVDEGNRDDAVFALVHAGRELGADRLRDEALGVVELIDGHRSGHGLFDCRCSFQQASFADRLAEAGRRDQCGRRRADRDLPGARGRLHPGGHRDGITDHQQFPVRLTG